MTKNKKLAVFGMGYIGLPTAIKFAESGFDVLGLDISLERVEMINSMECPISEPGLSVTLENVVRKKCLNCSTNVQPADVFIIAVPTPILQDHNNQVSADLSYVMDVCEEIAKVFQPGNLVILESTSPVGTTQRVLSKIRDSINCSERGTICENEIHVAYCPERVIPGNMLTEIVNNDRIIGGLTNKSTFLAKELYQTFVKGTCWETDARTAEMCKLTENAFRDVEIAFANELSVICDDLSLNVWELIELANRHPRVNILQPGPGVGGHCIAVDPWFIIASESENTSLIKKAREINDSKPNWVVRKVRNLIADIKACQGIAESSLTVVCYGVTYKANVEDIRESPALKIVHELTKNTSARIAVVDKYVSDGMDLGIELVDLKSAEAHADIAVLLVDHDYFRGVCPTSVRNIIDTRGLWQK